MTLPNLIYLALLVFCSVLAVRCVVDLFDYSQEREIEAALKAANKEVENRERLK